MKCYRSPQLIAAATMAAVHTGAVIGLAHWIGAEESEILNLWLFFALIEFPLMHIAAWSISAMAPELTGSFEAALAAGIGGGLQWALIAYLVAGLFSRTRCS